jgi:hypothetical protein
MSLLWKELEWKGLLPNNAQAGDHVPAKEINFVFDNCGGQNKNWMVLWMLTILAKLKVAVIVRAIFLVSGHTKNDCDRKFD